MARPSSDQRYEAIAELKRCVTQHGRVEGARRAREKFSSVPKASWHRWVAGAMSETPFTAGKRHAERLADRATRHVPSPVSIPPGVVAADPAAAAKAIDFYRMAVTLIEDVELLRAFSMKVGPDGKPALRIPQWLHASAKLRIEIIRTGLMLQGALYDARKMQDFYDAIVAEVEAVEPEIARRIVERLERLNAERGMVDTRPLS